MALWAVPLVFHLGYILTVQVYADMPMGSDYGYGVTNHKVSTGKRCPACGKTKCKHGKKARVF